MSIRRTIYRSKSHRLAQLLSYLGNKINRYVCRGKYGEGSCGVMSPSITWYSVGGSPLTMDWVPAVYRVSPHVVFRIPSLSV